MVGRDSLGNGDKRDLEMTSGEKSCHFMRKGIMGESVGWQRVERESKVVLTCLRCLLDNQVKILSRQFDRHYKYEVTRLPMFKAKMLGEII